jgi:protease IV
LGLVDGLGSFDDATKAAARRAKLTDYDVEFMEPELSWAQELVLQMKTRAVKVLVSWVSSDSATTSLARVAQRFDPLTKEVERLSRFAGPNRLYAYCFCGAE